MIMIDPDHIARLIRQTAEAVILPRFRALSADQIREKKPGDLVTVADTDSEAMLSHLLTAALPGSAVCGEESVARDAGVLGCLAGPQPVWIIDPVDGTANFAAGREQFAVIVALVAGGEIEAGWIHAPIADRTVHARRGGGAWESGRRLSVDPGVALEQSVGAAYGKIGGQGNATKLLSRSGRIGGIDNAWSGGIEYLRMVCGETHFFLSSASMPWDHLAGVLLVREAGGEAGPLDGNPLDFRRLDRPMLSANSPDNWAALRHLISPPAP
jgi:fructose-1,6-bisphosphatase/inositol monophosphatase family enzyme